MSDAFLSAAETALAVFRGHRGGPVSPGTRFKRLTLRLDYDAYRRAKPYWIPKDDDYYPGHQEPDGDRVDGLALAHPAASQLEVLHLECQRYTYEHRPRLESLPCAATLRLLELTHCKLDPPSAWPARSAVLALPRLTDLQLRGCVVSEGYLQVVLHAAPALTNLVLVNVRRKTAEEKADPDDSLRRPFSLRCPTLTALELDTSGLYYSDTKEELKALTDCGIELDMPSMRSFCYRGSFVKLSLTSPAPGLARVELDVSRYGQGHEPTSRMLRSFSTTRALKLRLNCIEDIVAGEEEEGGPILLPTFPNLELLEVDGGYQYKNNETAALGMARLLGSCPVMSELWLRLRMTRYKAWKKDPPGASFAATVDRFNKLAASMASVSVQGGDSIGDACYISELPALSGCALSCLRKATLKFNSPEELNCLEVQLTKFLVENAMALEEMHVDHGRQFWTDHLCNNVPRWRADSFQRKNLPDTGVFRVISHS